MSRIVDMSNPQQRLEMCCCLAAAKALAHSKTTCSGFVDVQLQVGAAVVIGDTLLHSLKQLPWQQDVVSSSATNVDGKCSLVSYNQVVPVCGNKKNN